MNLAGADLTQGYDYKLLLAQTPDAAKPPSHRPIRQRSGGARVA